MSGRGSGGSPRSLPWHWPRSLRGEATREQGWGGEAWTGGVTNRHGVGWRQTNTNIQGSEDSLGGTERRTDQDRDASLKASGPWR